MIKIPCTNKNLDHKSQARQFLQQTSQATRQKILAPSLALCFIVITAFFASATFDLSQSNIIIIAAASIGAYMALNIGANDVANNIGPAVGANVITMFGALCIAGIFEALGALLAGSDVVGTIAKGIIKPETISDPQTFIWVMFAALISAALWINLATWIGAPVSTTHSIVGGVMGAGIASAGILAVNWQTMLKIAASWIISPLLGGVIAALFLWFIKYRILDQNDKITAARKWVPILISIMAASFTIYLAVKGLNKIIKIGLQTALIISIIAAIVFYIVTHLSIKKQSKTMENSKKSVHQLFAIPLICAAALLSFAHGSNDVANAIAPLSAIVHTVEIGEVVARVSIPIWVIIIGAFGISFGLFLFGPKLIRMVGQEITRLNPLRAYCVALSAAITVIIASWLALPVSSTHIAVGAVFGIGFFREIYWQLTSKKKLVVNVAANEANKFNMPKRHYRKLVRRSYFLTIIAAWFITVPASALLSAIILSIITHLPDIVF